MCVQESRLLTVGTVENRGGHRDVHITVLWEKTTGVRALFQTPSVCKCTHRCTEMTPDRDH